MFRVQTLWFTCRFVAISQARIWMLGKLSVLLCLSTSSCHGQLFHSHTSKLSGIYQDATGLTLAAPDFHRTGQNLLHHRHMLDTSEPQLEQNVSYVYDNMFPDVFVLSPHMDLRGYDLSPVQGKCSMDSMLSPAVAECAATTQQCCFNANTVTNLTSLPHALADMCNSIALNGRVCQGFTYDSNTKVATFKGQMPQQAIDVSTHAMPAVNVSLWWLNAANQATQSVDHRPSVLQAAPQFTHYLSAVGNCPRTNTSRQSTPEDPTTGRYLVQGPLYPGQDVATVNPVSTYTFYSYLDLANGDSLTPVNGTCNQNPNVTDYTPALDSCSNSTSGCCVDMSHYQGSDIIELYLAKVCNSIILNGSVCQAFNYNTENKLAFFKGQPPAQHIDYVLAACVMPNVSLWVATAAEPNAKWTDTRPTALAAPYPIIPSSPPSLAPGPMGDKNIGAALGTALGIAAPCLALLVWLAVTYTYRLEKHAIVTAVLARLSPADLADTSSFETIPDPKLSRSLSHTDSATAFIGPAEEQTRPSAAMLKVAKEMIHRCLRRWDSIQALRASTDSRGRGQGIWRERYEGVRASVMLLAIHNANKQLQADAVTPYNGQPGHSGCLLAAWQQSNHVQKNNLLTLLVRKVHEISEEEAQGLPDKDVDTTGLYDKFLSCVNTTLGKK